MGKLELEYLLVVLDSAKFSPNSDRGIWKFVSYGVFSYKLFFPSF